MGPALGGTRMWDYSSEEEAVIDVLRLSRGMSFKAAITGLELGGGKAVIIGDAKTEKTEALMRKFGQYVDSLGGKYITAEDVGMNTKDMEYVRMELSMSLEYLRQWGVVVILHLLLPMGFIWA